MSYQREGVNPLRPYYIPPTIGEGPELIATSGSSNTYNGAGAAAGRAGNMTSRGASYKPGEFIIDIDYRANMNEDALSVARNVKDFIDDLLWKYSSVLMAQPFEVAKTILQVRSQEEVVENEPETPKLEKRSSYETPMPEVRFAWFSCLW